MKPTFTRTLALTSACALALVTHLASAPTAHAQQGWTAEDRENWYWATQGSRLMPVTWFEALEQSDSEAKFSDLGFLTSFGFVAPPDGSERDRPIGFAKDRQADRDFPVTGISWYDGQKHSNSGAEAWMGLNCAACHTAQVSYEGTVSTIDGGPSLLDFQLFIEALDDALKATKADDAKWERFAAAVLDGRDTPQNRDMLEAAFETLLAWQIKTDAMNETPVRYGFGRLDAVGHILNKVLMFTGAEVSDGNPSNAPVSYPFIWDIWRQDRVQWNGVARNSRFQLPGDPFEYGALGRNTGEVLGVFGEINVKKRSGFFQGFKGFKSTVQTENLVKLELILQDLKAPEWPDHFPALDQASVERGAALFDTQCSSCHLTPDQQSEDEGTERMITFQETSRADQTDIWMACNAFVYEGPSGPLMGSKDADGEPLGETAQVANMLAVSVKGALLGDKPGLIKSAVRNFFGARPGPDIIESAPGDPRSGDRIKCLNEESPLLAYKARPLDGIWATAPYLHNGSVASLYELLLPADERMPTFWVGNSEYDPKNVGYVTDQPASGGFLFEARDGSGAVIEGNSNAGHEYGAGALSEQERMDLVEYMKSL